MANINCNIKSSCHVESSCCESRWVGRCSLIPFRLVKKNDFVCEAKKKQLFGFVEFSPRICGFEARAPVLAIAPERCTLGHWIRCTIGHYALFFLWVLLIVRHFVILSCLLYAGFRLNLKRLSYYVAVLLLLFHQRRHIWKWNECNKKGFNLKAA